MAQRRDVVAAGVVIFGPHRGVLLVHRPRYDDWSFPKGKLDPDELASVAAVREVHEETGLHVRLGPPLDDQRYPTADRHKTVHYWVGWPVGDSDVSDYLVNEEIDDVVWLSYDDAMATLTYPRDRDTLTSAMPLRKKTRAVVVLRHGKARSRTQWRPPDPQRPLVTLGHEQAQRLVALLAVYDVTRIISSASTRCVQTLEPYAYATGWEMERLSSLSEEDANTESVVEVVDEVLSGSDSSVLCTHRPVLPAVWDALGVPEQVLDPAAVLVVHHRRGRVVATELHPRP